MKPLVGAGGLVLVAITILLSPTAIFVITIPVLLLLGFTGMTLCAFDLRQKPRWAGISGLAIGGVFLLAIIGFLLVGRIGGFFDARKLGISRAEHQELLMNAAIVFDHAERQRTAAGTPPAQFNPANAGASTLTDPWGSPIRYQLQPSPRGYTFISNGPDTVPSTSDDLDLSQIQFNDLFELPPVGGW